MVAQSRALSVSNEHTKAMRPDSVGYSDGCWLMKSERCNRKPLHLVGSPSNFPGKASRGLTGGVCMAGAGGGLAAACG